MLRTKVEVHRVGKGGRIVIHFYNDEDLGALVEKMTITTDVSRETLDELNKYSLSILKKNKEINLISTSTEKSITVSYTHLTLPTSDLV